MKRSNVSLEALTRRRPLNSMPSRDDTPKLKRTLTLQDLIFYGVGCSVGAGIYSLVGIGAALAGPSIALSFLLCGTACCFTSLSYAEFSALVPLAGSAYTFSYVTFGELIGWLVGWNLTLGYAVSAAVVARSWALYLVKFIKGWLRSKAWLDLLIKFPLFGTDYQCCPLAMVIICLCTLILISGAKESTRFNTAMTILNLSVLGFVLVTGSGSVHIDNLTPVFPNGLQGMAQGAGLIFFAYLGFDMCSCLSEEVIDAKRNMPIGIVGSLLVSMLIYVGVSLVVVGMTPAHLLGKDVPIVNALLANACCTHAEQLMPTAGETCLNYDECIPILHPMLYYSSRMISFGAIFGLTTATFACLMGQPRVFYTMALDGLLPKVYSRVNPKTGIPTTGTIWTGILTSLLACFVDLEPLANVISLGTLQVFTFVNAGVIILRMRAPERLLPQEEDSHRRMKPQASPLLVESAQAAMNARSLGLIKKTSIQIRDSVRSSVTSHLSLQEKSSINESKAHWLTITFTTSTILGSAGIANGWHQNLVVACIVCVVVSGANLFWLDQAPPPATFACPFVPMFPLMGILCNSYMMGSMPLSTWYIIFAWLLLGLVVYFVYGIHHSELRHKTEEETQELEATSRLIPPTRSNRYGTVSSHE